MLDIRARQLEALELSARQDFVRRLAADLRVAFPDECAGRGDDDLSALVREALARGENYGLESERDLGLFTDLWLVLGPGFDRSLPWAAEILDDPYILDPTYRIDRLHERALRELSEHRAG